MIPVVLAFAVAFFLAAPIFIVVPMSFSTAVSFEYPPPGYWFGYYRSFFSDDTWLQPTLNSFVIAIATTLLTISIVVPACFGFVRYRFIGRTSANFLLMSPLIVPHVVGALAYYGFLAKLHLVGTYLGVIIAHTALSIPVVFLVICATLKGFDRSIERAAMSLGAGPLRAFLWVTVPVVRPGLLVGGLFAFLHSFNESVVAIFISGRNAGTLPKKMFESVHLEADPVIAVVSSLLITAALVGMIASFFFRGRVRHAH